MLKSLIHILCGQDWPTSQLFNELTFDRAFREDLAKAKKAIIIESPYMTERRAHYFAALFNRLSEQKVKIRINTRHPRCHSTSMRYQAETAAKILLRNGARIYTYNDLRHRKLAIIDNTILWEGSMNILSHGRSLELMRRYNSTFFCRKMIDFVKPYN